VSPKRLGRFKGPWKGLDCPVVVEEEGRIFGDDKDEEVK